MFLREKDKNNLIQIFNTLDMPVEVLAYGSRVNGNAHQCSDLDLVICTRNHSKIPADLFGKLRTQIQESNIPILVDLRDWAILPAFFRSNIEAGCELLYSNFNAFKIKEENHFILNEPKQDYH